MTSDHDLLDAAQRHAETLKPILLQTFVLLGRYVAAVIVAFFASISVLVSGAILDLKLSDPFDPAHYPNYPGLREQILALGLFIVIGFSGVFAGTFCLPRKNRWIGSVVLLALGLGFASYWLVVVGFDPFINYAPLNGATLLQALKSLAVDLPLAIGGNIAAVIHFLLRPKAVSSSSTIDRSYRI